VFESLFEQASPVLLDALIFDLTRDDPGRMRRWVSGKSISS